MAVIKTGHKIHDETCSQAEMIRQGAVVGASADAVKTAEIVYYRTLLASAIADGGVSQVPFILALRSLGTGGV